MDSGAVHPTRHTAAAILLLAGLLIRLPFLHVDFGMTVDMGLFRGWARLIQAEGLLATYDGTTINYPPLSAYLFAAAGWLEAQLGAGLSPEGRDALLNILIKMGPVAADVLTAGLIYAALREQSRPRRLLAAGAYLMNPAVWYISAIWGQIDSIYTLLVGASVVALMRGRLTAAWLALLVALSAKLQSISVVPVVAAGTWLRHGRRGLAAGSLTAVAAVGLLAAPWLAGGQAANLFLSVLPDASPRATVSAYNLWYLLLLGRVHNVSSLQAIWGLPITYRTAGLGLYGLLTLYVVAAMWRGKARSLALPAAVLALGLFVLLTEIHERFMIHTLPLLALAAALSQPGSHSSPSALDGPGGLWLAYAVLSATLLFNLITIAPLSPALGGNLIALQPDPLGGNGLGRLSLVAAGLNVLVLGWLSAVRLPAEARACA